MSMPSVPGFIEPPRKETLADLWEKPEGDYPGELWPVDDLRSVTGSPSGWLIVEECFHTEARYGGKGCVLIDAQQSACALEKTAWVGRELGEASVWNDGRFDNGLTLANGDVNVEFFVHARKPIGASQPVVEISYPFLWYWDAFPVMSGWKYLNQAGREQDLIQWEYSNESWKVEVRALELRQFLATSGCNAVIQIDLTTKIDSQKFERVDDEFQNKWAHFDIHILNDSMLGDRPSFSNLMGQYLVKGLKNSRVPRFEQYGKNHDYPTFIYKLDSSTGHPLTHTCDPDRLGTYFDKDKTRLHYLTPIYFKREVLQPYTAEPSKYQLSSSRLSCLNLWGLNISFNSAGLVEVYLGDLGSDLPSDEWGHWRAYNVPPEGQMDEGRFRRDFLGQWVSSKDTMRDLRTARKEAAQASEKLLGAPIWKKLDKETDAAFSSLIGPTNNDPASLGGPLLTLTKVLVDGIDPTPLKASLKTVEKDEKSLRLLKRYADELGDMSDTTAILRELQSFRSKGGIAHLGGSGVSKAKATLKISEMSNVEAFESIASRITDCLVELTALMNQAIQESQNGDGGTK